MTQNRDRKMHPLSGVTEKSDFSSREGPRESSFGRNLQLSAHAFFQVALSQLQQCVNGPLTRLCAFLVQVEEPSYSM